VTPPEPWLMRRLILMPLAGSHGLDYETEAMAPGSSEVAQAYGFVSCGADLLVPMCYIEGFPSADRRTTKRGVKWVRDGIIKSAEPSLAVTGEALRVLPGAQAAQAQVAAVFLAQAMALNFEMMIRRVGDEYSENLHRSFRELIQRDAQDLDRAREALKVDEGFSEEELARLSDEAGEAALDETP
jgi:hypothetical protein